MAALVIGNAAYPDGSCLANAANDAIDLGAKLKSYGFNVIVATDCSKKQMEDQLRSFRGLLATHEVGLFFFAGHGLQIEGVNYLIALDTVLDTEIDAKHESLSLDKVIDVMAKSQASTKIIILDACRSNPWERKWHRGAASRGLASVYAPKGTIIGYATSPGEVAFDGVGRNGTYTEALLQHIDATDCAIETMFKRVRNTIAAATNGKQTSWEHTSLSGEFYFNLSVGKLIGEYDGSALADRLFALDDTKKSHQIIAGLKTYNYYTQNPALAKLNADSASRMGENSLFVLGRNIYQAACGGARDAVKFVEDFVGATKHFDPRKRKAILDGILFEIFFDSRGELRKQIKGGYFNQVFELESRPQLRASFDFIAEALTAARADLYTLPGKGHELSVAVSAKKAKVDDLGDYLVSAIYVDGRDVLRPGEDTWNGDKRNISYFPYGAGRLNETLAVELVVPRHLLNITYTPPEAGKDEYLRFPTNWTVRKS